MSYLGKQQEAKISLVNSIALSQNALARILSSIADVSSHSEISARSLQDNIRLLTQYQSTMCRMMTGIQLHCHKDGVPTLPWLNLTQVSNLNLPSGLQEE
ncbi:MAG TPA: hypothetical protein VGI33_06095 [Paenibacillus sp.]|jgi:hypothetical protein